MSRIHYLWFDTKDGRWHIGDYGLHCGDCFQVQVNGTWIDVRIELCSSGFEDGWYLIGTPAEKLPKTLSIAGLPCRKYA